MKKLKDRKGAGCIEVLLLISITVFLLVVFGPTVLYIVERIRW